MNVANGNTKKAMEFIERKSDVSETKMEIAVAAAYADLNKPSCGGLKDVEVVYEKVRGDVAKVTVELVCHFDEKKKENVILTKNDEGVWRITSIE